MRRIMAAALFGALGACATGMNENECAGADWFAIGEQDGLYGEARERFGARAEQCAKFGLSADYDAYFAGRERGLERYCTPESGYNAGRSGEPYRGVCPAFSERGFLAEYEIGRELHRLTELHRAAVSAYESALSSIDYDERAIRRARDELRKPDLSEEKREKLRREIENRRRDIERNERSLPRLSAEIDEALGRLEDYRAFLARRY